MGKPWSADFRITEEFVEQLVSAQFPELRILQIRHFDSGWDNDLFEINTELIFRFPRRQVAAKLIDMENRLLPALAPRLPLPIPLPIYAGKETQDFPYPFSGYRKLQGVPPFRRRLNHSIHTQSADLWAQFLQQLHQINVSKAVDWGADPSDDIGRMNMDKRKPLYIQRLEDAYNKGLVENFERLAQIVYQLPEDNQIESKQTLVHGDLNFRNFLINEQNMLCGVLDWGDAHIGHPAEDLSVVYSFLPNLARERFYRIYGTVSPQTKTLARFRALFTNLTILLYAYDIGDWHQVSAAERSLRLSCET